MEASFGRDFSRVRIHDGSEAGQSARDVGASAWTVGSNIAFAPGHYAPDSSGGRRLLAHELAHVVQQGAAAGGEPQVLRRSLALNSTMEICRRSLTSRNFGVERGGLKVVLDVAPVDTSIVDCQDHPFWVTLTRVKDWDFDPDHGTCPARTGTSSLLEFGNVPKGEYYLGINRSFDHPYCCLEGGIRAYDVVVPQNSAGCSEGKSLSVMDIVHGALDVAGFVPVLGAVPDVINAVIYVAEGDFENAGLSVIAAVPGAGDAVKGTAMTTKVIIKVTEETAVTLGTKGLGQAIKEAKIVTKEGVKVEKAAVKEGASGTAAKTVAKTAKVPQKAHDTLAHIRKTGSPPKGYAGGRVFQNREGKLPKGGSYREYDVDPRGPGGRNAERIVVDEKAGKAWYTGDHYGSFTPM
jgi:guanyl-specific ribonuclease Sa